MENKMHDKDLPSAEEKELFSKLEFSYSKSKEDVWGALEGTIDDEPETAVTPEKKTTKIIRMGRVSMSIAASLLLLLSCGLFARYYTKTISVSAGEFTSHTLPDGSEVQLNAVSSITYAPYWWRFNRKVALEGEAYFEVEKGKKFSVHSDFAVTEVLGTKFNIYARDEAYEVFCETGKVGVSSDLDRVVLMPGEFVRLKKSRLEKENAEERKASILSWRYNQFNYNTTPFYKVFADFERHYGITIELAEQEIENRTYTGAITRSLNVADAFDVVLDGYIALETSKDTYLIKKK